MNELLVSNTGLRVSTGLSVVVVQVAAVRAAWDES